MCLGCTKTGEAGTEIAPETVSKYLRGYNPDLLLLRVMIYRWAKEPDSLGYNTSFYTFYSKFGEDIGKTLQEFNAGSFLNDRVCESLLLNIFHETYHLIQNNREK